MTSAIGCFQPGTFLSWHAHAEGCYQKAMTSAKCLPNGANPQAVAEPSLLGLGFF